MYELWLQHMNRLGFVIVCVFMGGHLIHITLHFNENDMLRKSYIYVKKFVFNFNICCRQPGKSIIVNGKRCINLATLNFLNFIGNKDIEVSTFFVWAAS